MTQPFINFRSTRASQGPGWLVSQGESELVGWTLDVLKDAFAERLRRGLLARFPQQNPSGAPGFPDALTAIGRDRRLIQGANETNTQFAARLLGWLDVWSTAGNAFALLGQIASYLGPTGTYRTVDIAGNWYSLTDGVPSVLLQQNNWDWDGQPNTPNWARFWVIIYPGIWAGSQPVWGTGTWGAPRLWGLPSSATADQVQTVRQIIQTWKPAGCRCVNILVPYGSGQFEPTTARDGSGVPNGTWGNSALGANISNVSFLQGVT